MVMRLNNGHPFGMDSFPSIEYSRQNARLRFICEPCPLRQGKNGYLSGTQSVKTNIHSLHWEANFDPANSNCDLRCGGLKTAAAADICKVDVLRSAASKSLLSRYKHEKNKFGIAGIGIRCCM